MKFGIYTVIVLSTLTLIGCEKTELSFGQSNETPVMHDNEGNVRENMKLEPLAPISENTPIAPAPQKIAKPKTLPKLDNTAHNIPTTPTPTTPVTPEPSALSTNVASQWQPNEALLIRSTELIAGLQRELGKKPSPTEMQQRLQTHMGLTATQAQTVISVIGG